MSTATAGLADVARDLARVLDAERPRLDAIAEAPAGEPRAAGKWSRKEVLGHLIDSATNNHQRFVRVQLGPALTFPAYEQEKWVATQAYRQRPWAELVALWSALNRHLVHVLERMDPQALDRSCTIGADPPLTVRALAADYVRHLRHHLAQI